MAMSGEHWTLVTVLVVGVAVVWLQVRALRRESQRFWLGTAGTLIQLWRHLDPEGAKRFDRDMGKWP